MPSNKSSDVASSSAKQQNGFYARSVLKRLVSAPLLEVRFDKDLIIKLDGKEAPFVVREVTMNECVESTFLLSNNNGRMEWPIEIFSKIPSRVESTCSMTFSILNLVGVLFKVSLDVVRVIEGHFVKFCPNAILVDIIYQMDAQEITPFSGLVVKPTRIFEIPSKFELKENSSSDGNLEFVTVFHNIYLGNFSLV
ncbi:predicted protein [Naegleria gruberi]|uniref:Predicted protein n=1 Tax=Naegleria gruberi TaxID=5762 RepID=D2VMI3_NAEGR|nr:uncharacterized protein NAEGRDRAFT_70146 [Naegleria gruberi]EFC42067.1 predicted protein [Naegleria gruberi]|eukprot:XP_002674811.1 predicted protein [Naegleria gruberi strain NEG-M]